MDYSQFLINKLLDSIISIVKVLILSDYTIKIPRAENTQCAILGTGPSLKESLEENLTFINTCELFCLNLFSVTAYYPLLKPKNYLLLDPIFIKQEHQFIKDMIDAIVEKTVWEMNLFVPKSFLKSDDFMRSVSRNPHIRVIPFNYTIVRGFDWLTQLFFRKNLGMPQSQNVMVATLFYALNMGFEKIFLFGADHSWHEGLKVNEHNEIVGVVKHFYEENNQKPQKSMEMTKQFMSLYKVFYGYEVLVKYADKLGVKVYNASGRSYIDVFEKIKINEFTK